MNYELYDVACSPDSPGSSGPKVVTDDDRERITEPRPICPAGLTYINEAYGESSSGGGNFLAEMPIYFPENFRLNPTYRQQDQRNLQEDRAKRLHRHGMGLKIFHPASC